MLAVFFPWLAFFLRGRIFSAIFSFILWVVLCLPVIATIVATFIPDLRQFLDFLLIYGFAVQIAWFFGSFLLWVVLTVWCCLVMHSDQKQEDMEQLIKVIEANSGKSLHYETQQEAKQKANKTKMWYLIIIFLISLAILAVFFIKRETNQATTQATANQALSKKLTPKILTQRTTKRVTATLKCKTKCKNNKEAEAKER